MTWNAHEDVLTARRQDTSFALSLTLLCSILSEIRADERREAEVEGPRTCIPLPCRVREQPDILRLFLHRLTTDQHFPSPVFCRHNMSAHPAVLAAGQHTSFALHLTLLCSILSEIRAEERREVESKDPENVYSAMPFQGVQPMLSFLCQANHGLGHRAVRC